MPEVHVPDRLMPIIARILRFRPSDYEQLHGALESVQPALTIENLVLGVSKALPKAIEDVGEIVRALDSMTRARLRADRTIDQFLQDIAPSIEAKTTHKFDTQKFFERFSALLSTQALLISAKATDLLHDFDRVFISAEIVSDVRTVFDDNGMQIKGSIIVHNLNITHVQDGEIKNFFVAMDGKDISKFRTVLDRADAKAGVLRELIEGSGIQFFEAAG